jgi:hypothetical protein
VIVDRDVDVEVLLRIVRERYEQPTFPFVIEAAR